MALKVFRFDASGCNGCDIEILSTLFNPEYSVTGIEVVDSPEKAQAMIVTGGCNEKTASILKEAHGKLLAPKLVIAMGACASSMCVFKDGYNMRGPVDTLIPVNYFILGCPPRPQNLAKAIHGLLETGTDHSSPLWLGPEGLRARMVHDEKKCTACGACVNMCPSAAIDLTDGDGQFRIAYHLWKCSFCGTCQQACPEEAVKLTPDYVLQDANKISLVVTGKMDRTSCAICGKPNLTKTQIDAVGKRILEHDPALSAIKREIDESLQTCLGCKTQHLSQAKKRKEMGCWAYNL